jgi:hypothetical protein
MHLAEATMRDQQRTKDQGLYRFLRGRPAPGDVGYGMPIKPTGMICTAFRQSDDPVKYLFNIPENLLAVTALGYLAEMSDAMKPGDGFAVECRALAAEVQKGIQDYGIVDDPSLEKYTPMNATAWDTPFSWRTPVFPAWSRFLISLRLWRVIRSCSHRGLMPSARQIPFSGRVLPQREPAVRTVEKTGSGPWA